MLCYYSDGPRDYAAKPVACGQVRPYWEFQAVVRGRIARVASNGEWGDGFASSLWLSRPGSAHGWSGEPGEPAEVVVFHFRHLPAAVENRLGRDGFLRVSLDESERGRILELSESVRRYWDRPSPGMLLCADAVSSALALLIYEKSRGGRNESPVRDDERVGRALAYYADAMADNPSLERVAARTGVSAVHLRRLFRAKFGRPPKAVFDDLRDRRILQLLTDGHHDLAAIAELTGYSEPSAFSRAFKSRFGCPPSRWNR